MVLKSLGGIGRALGLLPLLLSAIEAAEHRFEFHSRETTSGWTHVPLDTRFEATRGYGFLRSGNADDPRALFAVELEEGNYNVTIRFGSATRATSSTVKAEARRLLCENVETAAGVFTSRSFTVNVRRPAIGAASRTMLNEREMGPPIAPGWDDYLTFEFNGKQPGVAALEIVPAKDSITIFLAGDSTVTDQRNEPWAGWGQMLPRFFQKGVAISNQAESGLSLSSFERQKRLEKVLSMMKRGDYLFIQFGHNDQKSKAPGAGPFTTYAASLRKFVALTRKQGGIPILVTPMERRRWEGAKLESTLNSYADAVRQVAAEEKTPLIELHAMSLQLCTALGPEGSAKAFVHFPPHAFPGQERALKDNTHHSTYGAYELARCVVEAIRTQVPALAARLVGDTPQFDPTRPDTFEAVVIPPSSMTGAIETPAGS